MEKIIGELRYLNVKKNVLIPLINIIISTRFIIDAGGGLKNLKS
jgi:hypothetical protein